MKKNLLLILGFTIFILASCEYKYIDPIEYIIPDGDVSFVADVEPILQDKCATCHASTKPILSEGRAYNSLIDGDYINTDAPKESTLLTKIASGHPGSNSLLPDEKGYILKWIQDGAENN